MGQCNTKKEAKEVVEDVASSRRVLQFLSPKRLEMIDSWENPPSDELIRRAAEAEASGVVWRDHLSRAFGGGCPNGVAFPV
jgi:hypothetical protein